MNNRLDDKRIAFLATNGVQHEEFTRPWEAARDAGAHVELISTRSGEIYSMEQDEKRARFQVDRTTAEVSADEFDGLVIPGGVASPDRLRVDAEAVELVRVMGTQGKPIASICHGPWMLIEADLVRGRTLTSWPSLRTDIENAGGRWVDEEVHAEDGIVTSRKPQDLDAFCAKMIEEFTEVAPARRIASTGI